MISGSFKELRNLVSQFQQTDKKLLPAASKAMFGAVNDQYARGFAQQRSPWGDQWVANKTGNRTGYRTGAMMATVATLAANVVKMRPPRYWSYFQVGAPADVEGNRHPRGILPFGPSKWDGPVESAVKSTVESYFAGAS